MKLVRLCCPGLAVLWRGFLGRDGGSGEGERGKRAILPQREYLIFAKLPSQSVECSVTETSPRGDMIGKSIFLFKNPSRPALTKPV